jgi:hypothetical protein
MDFIWVVCGDTRNLSWLIHLLEDTSTAARDASLLAVPVTLIMLFDNLIGETPPPSKIGFE